MQEGQARTFQCKCSFLEIYNETLTDLLNPSDTHLLIREDIKHGVYVQDLKEIHIDSGEWSLRSTDLHSLCA